MSLQKLTPIIAEHGSEPRFLKDRFADIVNAKDFGAIGDGHHDDTVNLYTASFYGAVFLPKGDYKVTEKLNGLFFSVDYINYDPRFFTVHNILRCTDVTNLVINSDYFYKKDSGVFHTYYCTTDYGTTHITNLPDQKHFLWLSYTDTYNSPTSNHIRQYLHQNDKVLTRTIIDGVIGPWEEQVTKSLDGVLEVAKLVSDAIETGDITADSIETDELDTGTLDADSGTIDTLNSKVITATGTGVDGDPNKTTGFVGNVRGNVEGNATSADKFSTPQTITLAGDTTGSISFGTEKGGTTTLDITVKDNSHNHTVENVTGLPSELMEIDARLDNHDNELERVELLFQAEVTARSNADDDERHNRIEADRDLATHIRAILDRSDMVDVVLTKAALDAYSKSAVSDNDIIVVLKDESGTGVNTNAIGFYRYEKSDDDWHLVTRLTIKDLADRLANTLDFDNKTGNVNTNQFSTLLEGVILEIIEKAMSDENSAGYQAMIEAVKAAVLVALDDKVSDLGKALQEAIALAVAEAISKGDDTSKRIADLLRIAIGIPTILESSIELFVSTSGKDNPTYQDMINANLMTDKDIPSGQSISDVAKDSIIAVYKWGSSWNTTFASINKAALIAATYFNLSTHIIRITVAEGTYGPINNTVATVTLGAQTRTTGRIEIVPRQVNNNYDEVNIYNVTYNGFVVNADGVGEYVLRHLNIIGVIPNESYQLSTAVEPVRCTNGAIVYLDYCNLYCLDYNTIAASGVSSRIYGRLISCSDSGTTYIQNSCSFTVSHLSRNGNALAATDALSNTVVEYICFYINDGKVDVCPTNDTNSRNHAIFGKNYVRIVEASKGSSFNVQSSSQPYLPKFLLLTNTSLLHELVSVPIKYNNETLTLTVLKNNLTMPVTTINTIYLATGSVSFSLQKYFPGSELVTDSSGEPIEESSDAKTSIDTNTFCSRTWTTSAQGYGVAESYYPNNFSYNV